MPRDQHCTSGLAIALSSPRLPQPPPPCSNLQLPHHREPPLRLLHHEATTSAHTPEPQPPPSSHHADITAHAPFLHTSRPNTVAPCLLARSAVANSKLRCVAFATIVFVQHIVRTTIAATLAGPATTTTTHGTITKPLLISFTVRETTIL